MGGYILVNIQVVGLMSYVEFQHRFTEALRMHVETLKAMRSFWEVLLSDESKVWALTQP